MKTRSRLWKMPEKVWKLLATFCQQWYFIPDLVYSGEIMKLITELGQTAVDARRRNQKSGDCFRYELGGDIHDIGKHSHLYA